MESNLLMTIAIIVFLLMFLGLTLTVLEFRNGEPKQQDKEDSE